MTPSVPHVALDQHEPPRPAPAPGRAFVPTLLAIGLVVSIISALGAPLIPTIAHDTGASLGAAQWSLTATLLVGAVTSPLIGRLGDGPHRRPVLIACLALVTLGGVVAALAGGLALLIAGRALQGLGLALMPLTMAAARSHLPPLRAGPTIAMLSVTGATGVGLGYPLTGLIADHLDLSAAFWAGAAGSGVALLCALFFVPASTVPASSASLDALGAVLVGGGVLALLLGVEQGADWGWLAAPTLALVAVSAVLLAAWVVNELRVEHPLVELRLVRRRAVLTANVSGFALGIAMYLGISLVTQVVQLEEGIDGTVFLAGLTLLPMSACSLLSARLMPRVRRRTGQRAIIPIGSALNGIAMLFLAVTGDAAWQAFVSMGFIGLGLGFTFAAMPGLIVRSVPLRETSSAMSFYQVSRYVGFSIGSGLAVTLLRAFEGDGEPGPAAYGSTLLVGAALCAVAAAVAWLVPGRALDGPARPAVPDEDERAVEEGEIGAAGLQRLED